MSPTLTNNIEKYGSGFIRIRKELKDYHDVDFSIEEVSGGVFATFKQRQTTREGLNEGLSEGLSEGLRTVLDTIQSQPGIQAKQLSLILERPIKSVERQIKSLSDRKLIERRGSRKTGGYFALKIEESG